MKAKIMPKYVLFLDIDGVLASSRVHMGLTSRHSLVWDKFDPTAIDFLNGLFVDYDLSLVLTSTWRNFSHSDPQWVFSAFRNAGFLGKWATPNWRTGHNFTSTLYGRALEVRDYLNTFPLYDDYLILDDTDFGFNKVLPRKRFVRTDAHDGMLHKHMLNVLSITGNWEKNGK
jgi:hypothetical protein